MKCVGCRQQVFERNAKEAIVNASNGILRMIDKIANTSPLIGNQINENIITADTIMKAVNDSTIS